MAHSELCHIVGLGACTPIGSNVWSSCAAARAGISGFNEDPFMIDTAGEPMIVARAPWLDVDTTGVERLAELLIPAMEEALRSCEAALSMEGRSKPRVRLALGLPPERPGLPKNLANEVKQEILKRFGDSFCAYAQFSVGHASGLVALEVAAQRLRNQDLDMCLVAGVDSYLEPETLEWLEENDQLHSAGARNNQWGFIPGEAAGCVVVASERVVRQFELQTLAQIGAVSVARENNLIKTGSVCIGEGLTAAMRGALAALPPDRKIDNVICDMNGEPYRGDEYGFTIARTSQYFQSASDFVAPADTWGDVGAASGPLFVAAATIAGRKGYSNGPLTMVWTSSEGGERAAALVRTEVRLGN